MQIGLQLKKKVLTNLKYVFDRFNWKDQQKTDTWNNGNYHKLIQEGNPQWNAKKDGGYFQPNVYLKKSANIKEM